VWFSADEKKIPLKIEGASGFGNTSMNYIADASAQGK
jgi:hypothetical protein